MTDHRDDEYRALRATIHVRGTARTCLFVAGLAVWAALVVTLLTVSAAPIAALYPLLLLAATFEAVFALHVGVERLGRYLQIFHEDRWELTAMAFGQPLAGTGADPLFAGLFGIAVVCNFLPVLVAGPAPPELLVLGLAHTIVLARLWVAKRAAARQRTADLERFRALRQAEPL
jgi:hypothetical protein